MTEKQGIELTNNLCERANVEWLQAMRKKWCVYIVCIYGRGRGGCRYKWGRRKRWNAACLGELFFCGASYTFTFLTIFLTNVLNILCFLKNTKHISYSDFFFYLIVIIKLVTCTCTRVDHHFDWTYYLINIILDGRKIEHSAKAKRAAEGERRVGILRCFPPW